MMNPNDKVDAVITWVDGNDPVHQAKRAQFLTNKRENARKDVAGETRFNQVGEIYCCIASILRFAPWINKIYIVTDNQDPHVEDYIKIHFPDNKIPVEVVDHKVVFEGYEKYLPTFNSLAITSVLWRIPGISEKFILFNDDVMLQRPVSPKDFYIDNKIVLYGRRWISVHETRITLVSQTLMRRLVGKKALLSFKKFMYNAARVTHSSRFVRLDHTPHAFFKSVFSEFFAANPQHLESNVSHRFRNKEQYSAAELHHLLAVKQGRADVALRKKCGVTLSPYMYDLDSLKKELQKIADDAQCLYFCVNSLDQSSPEHIDVVNAWMHDVLSLNVKD
ncbi:MAG: Stealth CR1 domain-containing protein [Muribaculaceae bacterium]|nr:Stealth CR1 domain-containing protein [Muribaculaceae bacterium]